jgi:hypothetical protein
MALSDFMRLSNKKEGPQGLKPATILSRYGTTKVVP